MIRSTLIPSASAAKLGSTRWRSTGSATRLMSFGRHGESSGEQRVRFGAEDERLSGARTGAPAHVALHEIRRASIVGARRAHERRRVAQHGVGRGHSRA